MDDKAPAGTRDLNASSPSRISLKGYRFTETIYESRETVISRGIREKDRLPIIAKSLRKEYPSDRELEKFKYEYENLKSLDVEGVIKPHALENLGRGKALIMEDFGGIPLNRGIEGRAGDLEFFLETALAVVRILGKIHGAGIIHKDIKPRNILINPETREIRIIDFGIASRVRRETRGAVDPKAPGGTLAYVSPEQTGRMNRSIDYRSDFYSLGIIFYEMLIGVHPFPFDDPMELIHAHMARKPVPPEEVDRTIPSVISRMVMKLMAKTAEERYQSAAGLEGDLAACVRGLAKTGGISDFRIGERDVSAVLQIPEKLYGRETETRVLFEEFERAAGGETRMVLFAGPPGIGKSFLINEIHKPLVEQRGYYISGKFDQYKKNVPYSAFIQAFRELIRQILTEPPERLSEWRRVIQEALGPNGQVVVDVLPELSLIIGPQPPTVRLGPGASQNRFNLTFQSFIRGFPGPSHPLVIFIDDWQWADPATLGLLEVLMTDPESRHLLFVGAYRDNEVSPSHPFAGTLSAIEEERNRAVRTVLLKPLEGGHVGLLVSDTLHCSEAAGGSLSRLITEKTHGNPFFVTQFLLALYHDGTLAFNRHSLAWEWEMEKVAGMAAADNVVDLMLMRLGTLPGKARAVLKPASCIGGRFDLKVLSMVARTGEKETLQSLWSALEQGLVLPLDDNYKLIPLAGEGEEIPRCEFRFLHDRVQQAAYALIPDAHKRKIHLSIGRLLLSNLSPREREERLFDMVNQLNFGVDLIEEPRERRELGDLNFLAGKKAKDATAYEAACRYFSVSLEFLEQESWKDRYEQTLSLYNEAAEAELLNINFERSRELAGKIMENARENLDKVKACELLIQINIAGNRSEEAVETGLTTLAMLNIPVSREEGDGERGIELPTLEALEAFPDMTDPYQLSAMRILILIFPPAFFARPELLAPIVLTMVRLCITCGHSAHAAYAYSVYGWLLCGTKQEMNMGYHSGRLAMDLLERYRADEYRCKVYNLLAIFVNHWKIHIRETFAPMIEGIQRGVETGDIEYGSYNIMNYYIHLVFSGERLPHTEQKILQYEDLLHKLKQDYAINHVAIWRQMVLNIMGRAENETILSGTSFREEVAVPRLRAANNNTLLFVYHLVKLMLEYLFGNHEEAAAHGEAADRHSGSVMAFMFVPLHNFYYSLALLAGCDGVPAQEGEKIMERVSANQEKMAHWAAHAPSNYRHKHLLVTAERLRVEGALLSAMEYYDLAASGAREQGYIQEEALAHERAGLFYRAMGREEIAKTYMGNAARIYEIWGAVSKVRALSRAFPDLLGQSSRETASLTASATIAGTVAAYGGSFSKALDFDTVMKATQAISGEIVMEKLLGRLLSIVMENAGAEKAVLLLNREGELTVAAEGGIGKERVTVPVSGAVPLSESSAVPESIVRFTARTKESVVLDNAAEAKMFAEDPYVAERMPGSVFCMPVIHQNRLTAVLYLENNLSTGAFTERRKETLAVLAAQAAISLENAMLYDRLEELVAERTRQLDETHRKLVETAHRAGMAEVASNILHNVGNVLNSVNTPALSIQEEIRNSSVSHMLHGMGEMLAARKGDLGAFMTEDPRGREIPGVVGELAFLLDGEKAGMERKLTRLLKNLDHIKETVRLQQTYAGGAVLEEPLSLSTLAEDAVKLHMGSFKEYRIRIERNYESVPEIRAGRHKVMLILSNLLSNARDALLLKEEGSRLLTIRIGISEGDPPAVQVRVGDNGIGIPKGLLGRIFQHGFTTKQQGHGFGLHSSAVAAEELSAVLRVESDGPGKGTLFILEFPRKTTNDKQ